MFLNSSPGLRHLPFLLAGFHGTDFPAFKQYYEDTKTAFVLLLPFGFPRYRYHLTPVAYSYRYYRSNKVPEQPGLLFTRLTICRVIYVWKR